MSMEDYNFAKAREAWATPVKIFQYNCLCGRSMKFESEHGVIAPQREWVELTDEDIWDVFGGRIGTSNSDVNPIRLLADARKLEAKLKQKNGFAEEKNT